MPRQYVSCKFAGSKRTYTYHNDGPAVAVDDQVDVKTDRGIVSVTVVDLWDCEPGFATKPIIGKTKAEAIPPAASEGGTNARLQGDGKPGRQAADGEGSQSPFGRESRGAQ